MKNFPITSYASSSSDLSDKMRYPYFSRTTPDLRVQATGIATFLTSFGWRRCALLHVDDPWGNSFATNFLSQAGAMGVLVLVSQKFADDDEAGIRAAVAAARASSARVFVYLEDTGNNLEHLLLAARDQGIAGRDGYAWVTFEQNDPETQLALAAAPRESLRPLLVGWLNLFGAGPSAADRRRYEAAFSAADRAAVRNPLVDLPAAAFDPPAAGGFLLTAVDAFAYDAVWATALGIARGAAPGAPGLVGRIRAAAFRGASGRVAFSNATGDRAADGLTMLVNNVQAGGAGGRRQGATDWAAATLVSRQVPRTFFTPGLHLVYTWFTPGLPLIHTRLR
jgi:ABC-type branched-subunit amino acid transport system substrate-binding protein